MSEEDKRKICGRSQSSTKSLYGILIWVNILTIIGIKCAMVVLNFGVFYILFGKRQN